jgi:hypothetical protein
MSPPLGSCKRTGRFASDETFYKLKFQEFVTAPGQAGQCFRFSERYFFPIATGDDASAGFASAISLPILRAQNVRSR